MHGKTYEFDSKVLTAVLPHQCTQHDTKRDCIIIQSAELSIDRMKSTQ